VEVPAWPSRLVLVLGLASLVRNLDTTVMIFASVVDRIFFSSITVSFCNEKPYIYSTACISSVSILLIFELQHVDFSALTITVAHPKTDYLGLIVTKTAASLSIN
jgi:hypothetical protein